MKRAMLALAGLMPALFLVAPQPAQASGGICVWFDETGMHVGPCPPPPTTPPPSAAGFLCGFASNDDPTGAIANPGTQVGEIDGGPVAVADLPSVDDAVTPPVVTWDVTGNPASATITCALQVGGTGTYAEGDAVSASASGTAAVYLPPTAISYQATATDPVWSCTTWTLTDADGNSETIYADDVTGEFSTDPTTAKCALATSQSENPCDIDPTAPGCTLPDAIKP
jgi:hypothetical protein